MRRSGLPKHTVPESSSSRVKRGAMAEIREFTAEERRRRDQKFWASGALFSVVIHGLLFLLWSGNVIPDSPFAAPGPRAGDNLATAGSMQAINVRVLPPVPIVPPPVPTPIAVEIDNITFDDRSQVDQSSILGERPGLADVPGLEAGLGRGDAGTADQGLFTLQPASPRGMIIPSTNSDLRDTEVQVWVFVDENGLVVSDSTRLEPPTRDGSFNRRLIREASEWVFEPAQQEGRAVPSWFPYRIRM